MFTGLPSPAILFNFVAELVPTPVTRAVDTVSTVAWQALGYITKEPATESTNLSGSYRPSKSLPFFERLKTQLETPYQELRIMHTALQSKPKVSRLCPITDYITLIGQLSSSSRTHQIYQSLHSKWAYESFYRIGETNLKGLAISFITYILLEDSYKLQSPLHDKLVTFYHKLVPSDEANYSHIKALADGHPIVLTLLESSSPFLDFLTTILVDQFYLQNRTVPLNYESFVQNLSEAMRASIASAQRTLGRLPQTPLLTLLGPKQSLLGSQCAKKLQALLNELRTVLEKVKTKLIQSSSDVNTNTWLSSIEPQNLLTAFDTDVKGQELKESLMPKIQELLKAELIKIFSERASLFLEGLPTKITSNRKKHFEELAGLIAAINPHILECLRSHSIQEMIHYAESLENYEQVLIEQQHQYLQFLSQTFGISFIIHSLENSKTGTARRLKINHSGRWCDPTCHLVFFPEKNALRIDLLKACGLYTQRTQLEELLPLKSFRLLRKIKSENLTKEKIPLTANSTWTPTAKDGQLAGQIIYLRQHVITCLKLLDQKICLLHEENFDAAGNLEDDPTLYDLYHSPQELIFATQQEAFQHRLEKHITRLNQEISELFWLSECIYSDSVHKSLKKEIHTLLDKARRSLDYFYAKKFPELIVGLQHIIRSHLQEALSQVEKLTTKQIEYATHQSSHSSEFNALFSEKESSLKDFLEALLRKPTSSGAPFSVEDYQAHLDDHLDINSLRRLVPRLALDYFPPQVFQKLKQLKTILMNIKEAQGIDEPSIKRKVLEIYTQLTSKQNLLDALLNAEEFASIRRTFKAIFSPSTTDHLNSELLGSLIRSMNSMKTPILEIRVINGLIKELNTFIEKLELKQSSLSKIAELEGLKYEIINLKHQFMSSNPTKEELFNRVFDSINPATLNELPLEQLLGQLRELETLPILADEYPLILKELEEFIGSIKSYEGARRQRENLEELRSKLATKIQQFNLFNPDKVTLFEELLGKTDFLNIPKINITELKTGLQTLKTRLNIETTPIFKLLEELIQAHETFKGHKTQRDKITVLKTQLEKLKVTFSKHYPEQVTLFDHILNLPRAFDQPAIFVERLLQCKIVCDKEGPYLHVYTRLEELIQTLKRIKQSTKELRALQQRHLISQSRRAPISYLDAGSDRGDDASIGGASFSSDLGSMGEWETMGVL